MRGDRVLMGEGGRREEKKKKEWRFKKSSCEVSRGEREFLKTFFQLLMKSNYEKSQKKRSCL